MAGPLEVTGGPVDPNPPAFLRGSRKRVGNGNGKGLENAAFHSPALRTCGPEDSGAAAKTAGRLTRDLTCGGPDGPAAMRVLRPGRRRSGSAPGERDVEACVRAEVAVFALAGRGRRRAATASSQGRAP